MAMKISKDSLRLAKKNSLLCSIFTRGRSPSGIKLRTAQLVLVAGLVWLLFWLGIFRSEMDDEDFSLLTSVSSRGHFNAFIEYVNTTAHLLYPDQLPDCLYLLERNEDTGKLMVRQSMNTYWKFKVSFRRRDLTQGIELLERTVSEKINSQDYPILMERFEQTNRSLPFFVNWYSGACCCRQTGSTDKDSCNLQKNLTLPPSVPILRPLFPEDCADAALFVPTAPIVQQVVQEDKGETWETRFQAVSPNIDKVAVATHRSESLEHILLENPKLQVVRSQSPDLVINTDFFNYTAVLIADSSSYFLDTMCHQSVVLKVEDTCQNRFLRTLKPNVHYVPVQADLSDLQPQLESILGDEHSQKRKEMIQASHEWCQKYLTYAALLDEFAHSLENYVQVLDKIDQRWTQLWQNPQNLAGHFLKRPGGDSWTLPKSVVGAIKGGFRFDEWDGEGHD